MPNAAAIQASPPIRAIRRWAGPGPVAAVIAGDPNGRTRWSLVAGPDRIERHQSWDDAWQRIAERQQPSTNTTHASGFGTGWIVSIPYSQGVSFEPAAQHGPMPDASCIQGTDVWLARVEHGWVHDNRTDHWHTIGRPGSPAPPLGDPTHAQLGPVRGLERAQTYRNAVHRVIELIRAGDAFQVNLAHRLSAALDGSPRAVFADLAQALAPWHGCYLEDSPDNDSPHAIASLSPELFLEIEPGGSVTTRPMKGTRAGNDPTLALSPKDAAELAMIVDLMRNDLGRVCEFGSVRVRDARAIEAHGLSPLGHPAVWQGVATVQGLLRSDATIDRVLRSTFPPGSITGAPKIRAMQIIDELEHALGFDENLPRRGAYCGSCGFIGDDGSATLSVAIRTAIVSRGVCHYPIGAGIVADSEPDNEWQETLVKAATFLASCENDTTPEPRS